MADEKDGKGAATGDDDKGKDGDAATDKKDAADKGDSDKGGAAGNDGANTGKTGGDGKKADDTADDDDDADEARIEAEVARRLAAKEREKQRKNGKPDEKLEAAETELKETQLELWRTRAALKTGLTEDDLEFVTGDSEQEFMRKAKKLATRLGVKPGASSAAASVKDDKKKDEQEIDDSPGTPEPTARKGAGNGEGGKLKIGDVSKRIENNLRGSLGLRVVGEKSDK